MTSVLHTADVHLTSDNPERRDALEELLDVGEAQEVDVVTIGGDLFDRPEDVENLRTDLRNELFADRPFEIVLIPGNHDVDAFRGDVFFGDSCTVMTADPFEHWTAPGGELRITGLPYREHPDDDLLLALQDRTPFERTEVLLFHCSLDSPFDGIDTGGEDTRRYFPVSEAVLTELDFDYYLAGHYHSAHKLVFENGGTFTYPGTPASTRRSETGRRRVSVLTPSDGVTFRPLDTFHYATFEQTVTPGGEEDLLDSVRAWADTHVRPDSEATVSVDGFLQMDEQRFHERLVEAAGLATVNNETRNAQHILSRPLFQSFENELDEEDWDEETKQAVWQRTVDVFSHLAAQREI